MAPKAAWRTRRLIKQLWYGNETAAKKAAESLGKLVAVEALPDLVKLYCHSFGRDSHGFYPSYRCRGVLHAAATIRELPCLELLLAGMTGSGICLYCHSQESCHREMLDAVAAIVAHSGLRVLTDMLCRVTADVDAWESEHADDGTGTWIESTERETHGYGYQHYVEHGLLEALSELGTSETLESLLAALDELDIPATVEAIVRLDERELLTHDAKRAATRALWARFVSEGGEQDCAYGNLSGHECVLPAIAVLGDPSMLADMAARATSGHFDGTTGEAAWGAHTYRSSYRAKLDGLWKAMLAVAERGGQGGLRTLEHAILDTPRIDPWLAELATRTLARIAENSQTS